jgi:hypothetical protein
MRHTAFAGVIGTVLAVVITFLVVAEVSAVGGVPVTFEPDRYVYGWEGARHGVTSLVLFGLEKVWPFPAVALAGAALGVVVRLAFARQAGAAGPLTAWRPE